MLLTKFVKVKWSRKNKKWYEFKGYSFTKWNDEFEVNIDDLSVGSRAIVNVLCDSCEEMLKPIMWKDYKKRMYKKGGCYCHDCACVNNGHGDMSNTFETIAITHPYLVKYFVDKEDTLKYSSGSNVKVFIKCPDCGYEKETGIRDFIRLRDRGRRFTCPMCVINGRVSKVVGVCKKVKCLTTGEIFNTQKEAGKQYGVDRSNISKCCRNLQKFAGNLETGEPLRWEYYTEESHTL